MLTESNLFLDQQWLYFLSFYLLLHLSHSHLPRIHFLYDLLYCTVYVSTGLGTRIAYGLAVDIYCIKVFVSLDQFDLCV